MSTQIYGTIFPKSKAIEAALFVREQITSNELFIECQLEPKEQCSIKQNHNFPFEFKKQVEAYLRIIEISKTRCFGSIVFHSMFSTIRIPSIEYNNVNWLKKVAYDTRAQPSRTKMEELAEIIDTKIQNKEYILIPILDYQIYKSAREKFIAKK